MHHLPASLYVLTEQHTYNTEIHAIFDTVEKALAWARKHWADDGSNFRFAVPQFGSGQYHVLYVDDAEWSHIRLEDTDTNPDHA